MLALFLATIAFASPGPIQHKTFADRDVRAEIVYRIAHDRDHDTGEAAASPSVSTGTLTFTANGRRHSYDVANVLPIREHHIDLPERASDRCTATEALTRRDRYLAIESVYAEKGCKAVPVFIDLASGRVAQSADVD